MLDSTDPMVQKMYPLRYRPRDTKGTKIELQMQFGGKATS